MLRSNLSQFLVRTWSCHPICGKRSTSGVGPDILLLKNRVGLRWVQRKKDLLHTVSLNSWSFHFVGNDEEGKKVPSCSVSMTHGTVLPKQNQWLYLKSWNCQNSANFAQPAKEWLKELGRVGRRVRTCLILDSELVSYLNSHQRMQFRSLREGPSLKGLMHQPGAA